MNTELFADHLNLYRNKSYNIQPILEVIDRVINQIKEDYSWGYAIEYFLSSANHCTPSYASHFYKKHMLSVDQVAELLSMISEDKKISFDSKYADELYYEYNGKKYDDNNSLDNLKSAFSGKKVLIVAPGKSILKYKNEIEKCAKGDDIVSIALNNKSLILTDYAFVTKLSAYEITQDSMSKIILTSNVPVNDVNAQVVNYESLTSS